MAHNMHHLAVSDDKAKAAASEHIEQTTRYDDVGIDEDIVPRYEAPELVRNLTPEERVKLERKLVRKIDIRLLPALIVM